MDPSCGCSAEQVDLMFKRAEQYIDEQVANRIYDMGRYWVDMYPTKGFPDGAGLILDKVRFFGDIGPQYDGFDGWREVAVSRQNGESILGNHDGCGYVWEEVGHGLETQSYSLMTRDLRTKPICIKDIRTFWQYQQFQNLIFQNLANISANMREQLNRNAAMLYAIKYIALPNLPLNTVDPHQLPAIPSGVEVGKLTYPLLLQLYHYMVQEAGQYAIANLQGAPAFGLVAHPETLFEMYYSNADLRTDIRECRGANGNACDLINKYNFLNAMGPFVFMPDMYAPRYNRNADGTLVRVFPFDREVPIEIGTRPVTNPDYHTAEFELVLMLTRDLLTLRTRRPLSSVGGQTNFESEVGIFNWMWHNPDRCEDPFRRTGRYVTTAEIGIEPGDFTSIPGILVKRKPTYVGIEYWGAETCPPDPVDCDNSLPAGDCPCPTVESVAAGVLNTDLIITFNRATGAEALDVVSLETANGSTVSATVIAVSTDETVLQVRFASAVEITPGMFVGLACNVTDYCSAKVLKTEICNIFDETATVTLFLNRPIKAIATETVTLQMCDGSSVDGTVASVNGAAISYSVGITWAEYCAAGGICSVCVPPATDASCPDCDASVFTECEETS